MSVAIVVENAFRPYNGRSPTFHSINLNIRALIPPECASKSDATEGGNIMEISLGNEILTLWCNTWLRQPVRDFGQSC